MSRRLSVSLLPELHPPHTHGGTALVIDVLRATTTATTFLEQGADAVIFAPTPEVAFARREAAGGAQVRLAGERSGVIIPGFDLGNSPLDAQRQNWAGHQIVMNTTNGTGAAHLAAQSAERVLLACLRNAPAAAVAALAYPGDLRIVCSGTNRQVSLDDCYAAGVLVRELLDRAVCQPDDSAQMVLALLNQWPDPLAALEASRHGQRLLGLGDVDAALADLALDVAFCAKVGVSDTVPRLLGSETGGLVFSANDQENTA
ncbi:2-phosphosulfolactate phosphatase [Deinococcus radiophilus]|uniref:Probable 2-phosphosulfolactate phosphatase n=1 Tax=Deinococcus radiophilus TaxID=32062 RepID=A0A431VUW0_9DEIO|nr:2-phosphosulfolactate phosphatase [Deinococcus radiophilus]RTR27058.1 2-phosphosulfolactate phosphatase [Deinococcus radiophilus]UFA50160.1 2-phosphosulfolactate phosphatase [Deinococcus radiophilus]